MIKLIKYLFFPKWETLYSFTAEWEYTDTGKLAHHSFYQIQGSIIRNKFKLITSGYKPKTHQYYSEVLNQLAILNRLKLSGELNILKKEFKTVEKSFIVKEVEYYSNLSNDSWCNELIEMNLSWKGDDLDKSVQLINLYQNLITEYGKNFKGKSYLKDYINSIKI